VDGISLVVHVDPPKDAKDYLHRAGRTARAGESGRVATLVLPKQRHGTLAMLTKAGVAPAELRVRPGDAALGAVTGARTPSGVPVVDEPEPQRRAPRDSDRPRRVSDRPRRFDDRPRGEHTARGDGPDRGQRSFAGERQPRRFADRPGGFRHDGNRDDRRHGGGERQFGARRPARSH
jgi:superfamily II DNA/RNA helicase